MKNTPTFQSPIANTISTKPATVATVNAGTVRRDNILSFQSVFFGAAVLMAVILPALGGRMICLAYQNRKTKDYPKVRRFIVGVALIYIGLNAPHAADWLVASALDSSLCGDLF
jgi:hypothetical protein